MKAVRYGIFLEPSGPMLDVLVSGKRLLERRMPGQPYCSHPPHCTLIVGEYSPFEIWESALRQAVGQISPFGIATESWCFFHDDPATGGGQTVALKVARSEPLLALQLTVAETLRPFLADTPSSDANFGSREPFAGSLRRYGFPFVGGHWIAHFTLGSPKVARDAALLSELTAADPAHRLPIDAISVWQIEGDSHKRIAALRLGPYSA